MSLALVDAEEEEILADCADENEFENLDDAAFFLALRKDYARHNSNDE